MDINLFDLEKKVKPFIREAGSVISENWHKQKIITRVNRRDITTSIDIEIEDKLRSSLHTLLPEAGFIVEEGVNDSEHEYNWVIDPIDGTKNYIADIPLFNCQIALVYKNIPVLGVIYNPISDYYISAAKGHGAYLNGNKTIAPVRKTLHDANIDFDLGFPTAEKLRIIERLIKDVFRIYITGAQYSPYIMSGAIDAYISLNERIKPGDFYPRLIIMKEAGLKVEVSQIHKRKIIIAAHPSVFAEIKSILE